MAQKLTVLAATLTGDRVLTAAEVTNNGVIALDDGTAPLTSSSPYSCCHVE